MNKKPRKGRLCHAPNGKRKKCSEWKIRGVNEKKLKKKCNVTKKFSLNIKSLLEFWSNLTFFCK